jgi:hypothetical protein
LSKLSQHFFFDLVPQLSDTPRHSLCPTYKYSLLLLLLLLLFINLYWAYARWQCLQGIYS